MGAMQKAPDLEEYFTTGADLPPKPKLRISSGRLLQC